MTHQRRATLVIGVFGMNVNWTGLLRGRSLDEIGLHQQMNEILFMNTTSCVNLVAQLYTSVMQK